MSGTKNNRIKQKEKMNDKISIIIPCYKAEKFLGALLDDIIAQTYTNWEVIAVSNGAGQEPQLKLLRQYQEKLGADKLKIFTSEKGNVCNARNIGIHAATGDWTTFADDDDRIEPNHLQLFMDKAAECDPDIIVGGFKQDKVTEGTVSVYEIKNGSTPYLTSVEVIDVLSGYLFTMVWNKLFRSSFLPDNSLLFDEAWHHTGEDVIFMQQAFKKDPKTAWISMGGYHWVCRDEQSGSTHHVTRYEELQKNISAFTCSMLRQGGRE